MSDALEPETYTIDVSEPLLYSSLSNTSASGLTFSIGNSTISNGGTMYNSPYTFYTTNGTGNITAPAPSPNSLDVKGDANFEGDIKFKGKSLGELFSKIEDRLAILQPDPKKLEKYEALRKAYEHYKLLEKLVQED